MVPYPFCIQKRAPSIDDLISKRVCRSQVIRAEEFITQRDIITNRTKTNSQNKRRHATYTSTILFINSGPNNLYTSLQVKK